MSVVELEEHAALAYVQQVRRTAVARIEERLEDLEGKLAAHLSGPIEIPRAGSPMVDAWGAIVHELGRYACNFTVRGERMFVKSHRGGSVGGFDVGASRAVLVDTLDAFLDRLDPGSVNTNDALEGLCADLAAIRDLRAQRGAIMRDGVDDPRAFAGDELELAALTGPVGDAVAEVVVVDAELRRMFDDLDAESAAWEAFYAHERAVTLEQACRGDLVDSSNVVDMTPKPEPVGIVEIAQRLDVKRRTVDQWGQRDLLPAPRWTVGGRPCWDWADVEAWARKTGRLPETQS